jgi:D-alanine-D-alanine ligase
LAAAYIALHGRLGEDGTVQGLLELLGMPYTGSSVLASALAMDKIVTRDLLAARGLPVARGFTVSAEDPTQLPDGHALPLVVKPADEGSSFGISLVKTREDFAQAVRQALALSDRVLVEQFVAGPEVTVAVLDGEALGALEVEPHRAFYDYRAKYEKGGSTHHIPPRIAPERLDQLLRLGVETYTAIGCSGAARVDFIVPADGPSVILEVNTIPGMTELSLLPEIALSKGLSFDALVSKIMAAATVHIGNQNRA